MSSITVTTQPSFIQIKSDHTIRSAWGKKADRAIAKLSKLTGQDRSIQLVLWASNGI